MYNAFYYEDNYYLLPDGFSDYDSFIDAINNEQSPTEFLVVALREDHGVSDFSITRGQSMTPYFLSGYHDTPVRIAITDKDNVYPANVELYTQEEYNKRLREVILRACPGCMRYRPISDRVQSLNGHFQEIGLDGVCLFRQETKPSPRSFRHHLFSFGGFYMTFDYFGCSADQMREYLKRDFYVKYEKAELQDYITHRELILTGGKKELLLPLLTNYISDYLYSITNHKYRIRITDAILDVRSWLDNALDDKNNETFRKDCKKYGVSIAVLEYDAEAMEKVRDSLKPLIQHFWIFPIVQDVGRDYYLLSETSSVLKELRYRSPLLQAHGAKLIVYSQYGDYQYDISFDMLRSE